MMNMKIKINNELIIVYLIDTFFDNLERKELIFRIKEVFIRLIEYYNFDLKGSFECILYENIKYGTVLEIKSHDELLFPRDLIDIKVKFYKNTKFYFKTSDYFAISEYKNIYYDGKYYYIDLENMDNIINKIEFGDILYKEKDYYLNEKKFIQ